MLDTSNHIPDLRLRAYCPDPAKSRILLQQRIAFIAGHFQIIRGANLQKVQLRFFLFVQIALELLLNELLGDTEIAFEVDGLEFPEEFLKVCIVDVGFLLESFELPAEDVARVSFPVFFEFFHHLQNRVRDKSTVPGLLAGRKGRSCQRGFAHLSPALGRESRPSCIKRQTKN